MGNVQFYDATDPEVKMTWERDLFVEVARRGTVTNPALGLIGNDESSCIQRRKGAFQEGGTTSRITLQRGMRQPPAIGGEVLRDTEEGLPTITYDWKINQIRHAFKVTSLPIVKQRIPWDVWKAAEKAHADYWPKIWESGIAAHMAGLTIDVSTKAEWWSNGANLRLTLNNTPRTPDTNHVFRFDKADDAAVSLDPTAIIDRDVAVELKTRAKQLPLPIRPCMVNGIGEVYVFFVHSNAIKHMKQSGSQWFGLMRDRLKGGALDALSNACLGIDDEVLWVAWDYLPVGFTGTTAYRNTRRAVFAGAQAGALGFAKLFEDENTMVQETETWDYGNNKGLAVRTFAGAACPHFSVEEQGTDEDYGKIVVTSYAKETVTSA